MPVAPAANALTDGRTLNCAKSGIHSRPVLSKNTRYGPSRSVFAPWIDVLGAMFPVAVAGNVKTSSAPKLPTRIVVARPGDGEGDGDCFGDGDGTGVCCPIGDVEDALEQDTNIAAMLNAASVLSMSAKRTNMPVSPPTPRCMARSELMLARTCSI